MSFLKLILMCYLVTLSYQANSCLVKDTNISEGDVNTNMLNYLSKYNVEKSFIMSGYALTHTLEVLALAADAESKKQLLQALGSIPISRNTTVQSNQAGGANYTSANRIYLRKGLVVNPTFNANASKQFGSDVANLDFQNVTTAAGHINNWIKNKTEGEIRSLVNEDQLSTDIEAVIVTTLLFQAQWAKPFGTSFTKEDKFFVSRKKTKNVMFMNINQHLEFCHSDVLESKSIKVPFKGLKSHLFMIMPNSFDGLEKMIREYNPNNRRKDFNCFSSSVDLSVPKFSIETSINLIPFLESVGVSDIFSPSKSKLPFLTTNGGKVYVNHVIQQAFIEINENGVRAAAANAILLNYKMIPMTFTLNRPFYFEINFEGQVLFSGVYRS